MGLRKLSRMARSSQQKMSHAQQGCCRRAGDRHRDAHVTTITVWRFDAMAWEQIEKVVNVNLVGGLSLIHAAYPLLKATPGSLCFSTASGSAIFGTANMAVYSATKHAIKGLTEALAVEFAADGVRAADVLPGIIDTGMLDAATKVMLPTEGMWRPLPAEGRHLAPLASSRSRRPTRGEQPDPGKPDDQR